MNAPATKRPESGRIAIFNLDGCVSDDRWRRARVPEGASHPDDFKAYHDGAVDDPPLTYGAGILANHIANGDFIVFTTGRDTSRANDTAIWIRKLFHIHPHEDFIILMRQEGDHRAVVDLKADYAQYLIKSFCPETKKEVIAAYDNRRDVVEMYRRSGFDSTILNEDGEFVPNDASEEAQEKSEVAENSGAVSLAPNSFSVAQEYSSAIAEKRPINNLKVSDGVIVGEGVAVNPENCGVDFKPRTNVQKYPKYFKDVSAYSEIDVYLLLEIFGVCDHAIGHAIKKLLLMGVRSGGKPASKDIEEARDTLNRWLEIRSHSRPVVEHIPV